MPARKSWVIGSLMGRVGLPIGVAVAIVLLLSGCGGYGHIPPAGQTTTDEKTDTVQVILQWDPVPGADAYNVYWSRFAGVTKHTGHKIPDAANPIAITDLDPDTIYYFVVTPVRVKSPRKWRLPGWEQPGFLTLEIYLSSHRRCSPRGLLSRKMTRR